MITLISVFAEQILVGPLLIIWLKPLSLYYNVWLMELLRLILATTNLHLYSFTSADCADFFKLDWFAAATKVSLNVALNPLSKKASFYSS